MGSHTVAARRLRNSGLTGSTASSPGEVVARHLAMQAQDRGPAKWSIGQRLPGSHEADVDRAIVAGEVLRTHVLRPTWHLVTRSDIRWLLALTGPRVQKQNAPRCRELGLDAATLTRSERVVGAVLGEGQHLTRKQLGERLAGHGIDVEGQRLAYVLMHLELEALICSGAPQGKQQTYALLDERAALNERLDRSEAVMELTRRYLAGHGPATLRDLRWWSSITVADLKDALHALGPEVRSETLGALTLWELASTAEQAPEDETIEDAHLLQTYDEFIVGFTESRYLGDPHGDDARAAWKERNGPNGVVLIEGRIAGHWRRALKPSSVEVEVVTYRKLSRRHRSALDASVEALGRFLEREASCEISRRSDPG